MSNAKRFLDAFQGSELAHGQTNIDGRRSRTGKTEAKSFIVREPLTLELVGKHLAGQQGVGSIPINSENQCSFGVIDIDDYDLSHAELLVRVQRFKLPLIMCRSKSGGAHLYLFLDGWYDAKLVREYLGEMASSLGYAGREIFPKQDKILLDRGDVGNFINLPYFKADQSMRYAFKDDGEAATLPEFLTMVEANRVPINKLEELEYGDPREELKDYPPCLERIVSSGPLTEYRNVVMFNLTTAHKKAHPENWKQALEESNIRYCPTPLEAKEIVGIERQQEKKEYGYQCKATPLCNFCDKALCKTRKHGIGSAAPVEFPKVGGMSVLMANPRLFFLDIEGKRIEVTSEQLQSQPSFNRACIEQILMSPPPLKPADWSQLINKLLADVIEIEVPPELTTRGQFEDILREYCTNNIRAMVPEELTLGKPWTEGGQTRFTFLGLTEFLRLRNFTGANRAQIQEMLKDINNGEPCHGHQAIRRQDGKPSTIRVWWVPAYEDAPVEMRMEKNIGQEIPF